MKNKGRERWWESENRGMVGKQGKKEHNDILAGTTELHEGQQFHMAAAVLLSHKFINE